jgi:hypothetical protein
VTPIRVAHELSIQIFFSVWGEEGNGRQMPQDSPGELRKAVLTYNVTLSSASLVTSLPIDLYRLGLRNLPFDPDSAHVPRRTSLCRHMKRKQNDVARCRADGSTIIALVPDRCDLVPSGCALCLLLLYGRTKSYR